MSGCRTLSLMSFEGLRMSGPAQDTPAHGELVEPDEQT